VRRSSLVRKLSFLCIAVAAPLFAGCLCPPEALSKHLLISTAPGTGTGFVACGYEDARTKGVIRASEFEVFRCDNHSLVLDFDPLETADLRDVGGDLNVVRVANWPFGRHWTWLFVPIAETTLSSRSTVPAWQPRLPKPKLTRTEVRNFVQGYASSLQRLGREYVPDENVVAQMFAAMAGGDPDATRLFRSMRREVNLDGAAGEIYEMAVADYAVGRPPN